MADLDAGDLAWLAGDVVEVAPLLLNKVLVAGDVAGRIIEVEAYGGADDPASHAAGGPTRANASMFGRAGTLYVYRSYGVHWCANVVTGPEGHGQAVLLRAVEPSWGIEEMWRRRPAARRALDLCNGPGKLCAALAIDGDADGTSLVAGRGPVALVDDGTAPPPRPASGPRVGITRATERAWRWAVPGHAGVSRPTPWSTMSS